MTLSRRTVLGSVAAGGVFAAAVAGGSVLRADTRSPSAAPWPSDALTGDDWEHLVGTWAISAAAYQPLSVAAGLALPAQLAEATSRAASVLSARLAGTAAVTGFASLPELRRSDAVPTGLWLVDRAPYLLRTAPYNAALGASAGYRTGWAREALAVAGTALFFLAEWDTGHLDPRSDRSVHVERFVAGLRQPTRAEMIRVFDALGQRAPRLESRGYTERDLARAAAHAGGSRPASAGQRRVRQTAVDRPVSNR